MSDAKTDYKAIIETLGFGQKVTVEQRVSIANVFPKSKKRHGIYLLVFADGLFYIGKTADFVRRFAQHQKNHSNISEFYYQICRVKDLERVEEDLIHQAQSLGLPLTNIVHVANVLGETDLDLLFSVEEQAQWLDVGQVAASENAKVNDAVQRLRYRHKYEKFETHPEFATVTELLSMYVKACIPVPRRTEFTFWSVSCLPSTNASISPRFSCISINEMETFVVGHQKGNPHRLWMFMIVSESIFRRDYVGSRRFIREYPSARISPSNYRAAGPDQLQIDFGNPEEMLRALTCPVVKLAAKELNLRLMRKGATMQHRYHCFDLADRLLAQ